MLLWFAITGLCFLLACSYSTFSGTSSCHVQYRYSASSITYYYYYITSSCHVQYRYSAPSIAGGSVC